MTVSRQAALTQEAPKATRGGFRDMRRVGNWYSRRGAKRRCSRYNAMQWLAVAVGSTAAPAYHWNIPQNRNQRYLPRTETLATRYTVV
jgi:hypothetical protein